MAVVGPDDPQGPRRPAVGAQSSFDAVAYLIRLSLRGHRLEVGLSRPFAKLPLGPERMPQRPPRVCNPLREPTHRALGHEDVAFSEGSDQSLLGNINRRPTDLPPKAVHH